MSLDLQTATVVGLTVNNHKSLETVLTRLKSEWAVEEDVRRRLAVAGDVGQ
jgi:hypothetical protein